MEKGVDMAVPQLIEKVDILDENAGATLGVNAKDKPASTYRKGNMPKKVPKRVTAEKFKSAGPSLNHAHDKEQFTCSENKVTDAEDRVAKTANTPLEKKNPKADKEAIKEQLRAQKECQRLEKEKQRAEKQAVKEQTRALMELNRQEKEKEKAEKEAKKEQDRLQKEALRQEKELKRQQEEAEKEQKRREKEVKRQQEEVEKEQKRREKEAAEWKKRSDLQKQATIMDRFLQNKKENFSFLRIQKTSENTLEPSVCLKDVEGFQLYTRSSNLATLSMDQELNANNEYNVVELLRKHILAWNASHPSKRLCRWGIRRHPKAVLYKELRLQGSSEEASNEITLSPTLKHVGTDSSSPGCRGLHSHTNGTKDMKMEGLDLDWENGLTMQAVSSSKDINKDRLCTKHRKLLQFDKSHRPPYYGTFSKKSKTVGPRHPLKKDTTLDYDIDSDEEWAEDDPGESLSDCDKDEDDEKLDGEEDEAADGFVVPDGYLSENEGVQVEDYAEPNSQRQNEASTCGNSYFGELDADQQNHTKLQSILSTVTEHALRLNRPFILSNFSNQRHSEGSVERLSLSKTNKLCLEALRMQIFTPGVFIDPLEDWKEEKHSPLALESSRTTRKSGIPLPDSALPEMVQFLLSCSQGMKKTVDSLSKIFAGVSKNELENKVREISEFVGNHWQVKKEVMDRMGIDSPHTTTAMTGMKKNSPPQLRPITKFFSKRCLPMEETTIPVQSHEEQGPKKPKL